MRPPRPPRPRSPWRTYLPLVPAAAFVLVWSSGYISGPAAVRAAAPLTVLGWRFVLAAALGAPARTGAAAPAADVAPGRWSAWPRSGWSMNAVQFCLMYLAFDLGLRRHAGLALPRAQPGADRAARRGPAAGADRLDPGRRLRARRRWACCSCSAPTSRTAGRPRRGRRGGAQHAHAQHRHPRAALDRRGARPALVDGGPVRGVGAAGAASPGSLLEGPLAGGRPGRRRRSASVSSVVVNSLARPRAARPPRPPRRLGRGRQSSSSSPRRSRRCWPGWCSARRWARGELVGLVAGRGGRRAATRPAHRGPRTAAAVTTYPAPVGRTARRLEWPFLPPTLRAEIEGQLRLPGRRGALAGRRLHAGLRLGAGLRGRRRGTS